MGDPGSLEAAVKEGKEAGNLAGWEGLLGRGGARLAGLAFGVQREGRSQASSVYIEVLVVFEGVGRAGTGLVAVGIGMELWVEQLEGSGVLLGFGCG